MAQSIEQFCAALVPLMASATVMFAISTAYLTKVVPASENGYGIRNTIRNYKLTNSIEQLSAWIWVYQIVYVSWRLLLVLG
jgi:hypothetical protein